MQHFLNTAKALSDPSRVRVVRALSHGSLCVCQIVELLSLATSTVSKHMSVLRQAGLVESDKRGRWVHYSRPDRPSPEAAAALRWCDEMLADDSECAADAARLQSIVTVPLEELCRP